MSHFEFLKTEAQIELDKHQSVTEKQLARDAAAPWMLLDFRGRRGVARSEIRLREVYAAYAQSRLVCYMTLGLSSDYLEETAIPTIRDRAWLLWSEARHQHFEGKRECEDQLDAKGLVIWVESALRKSLDHLNRLVDQKTEKILSDTAEMEQLGVQGIILRRQLAEIYRQRAQIPDEPLPTSEGIAPSSLDESGGLGGVEISGPAEAESQSEASWRDIELRLLDDHHLQIFRNHKPAESVNYVGIGCADNRGKANKAPNTPGS